MSQVFVEMIKNSPFQGFSVKDLKVFANVEGVKYYYKK